MKAIVGAIIIMIVLFFVVPMIAGGSVDTCKALEKHVVTTQAANISGGNSTVFNTVNNAGQSAATGQIASTMLGQSHPNTPTGVSCTYYYWKSMF